MALSYTMWAMSEFNNRDFIMAGQSVGSLERNVIMTLLGILKNSQTIPFTVKHNISKHYFDVQYKDRKNRFYCFGGADADSYAAVQGLTAAGFYGDEVTLLNEEFVNQCTARCSVEGAKFWANCNPRHPMHWFKTNWIDQAAEKKALVINFRMEDNPTLTQKQLDDYKSRYKGVFYRRYINGEWCVAEGAVYENWRVENFDWKRMLLKKDSYRRDKYIKACGLDYGYTKPLAVAGMFYDKETNTLYIYKEIYERGLKLQKVYDEIKKADLHTQRIAADDEDPRMTDDLSDLGLNIYPANKGKVMSGIQRVNSMNVVVHPTCKNVISEYHGYSWKNDKNGNPTEEPVKENDHLMDAIRYGVLSIDSGFKFG